MALAPRLSRYFAKPSYSANVARWTSTSATAP